MTYQEKYADYFLPEYSMVRFNYLMWAKDDKATADTIFSEDLKETLRRVVTDPYIVNDLKGGHLAMMSDIDHYISVLDEFIAKNNLNYRNRGE